MKNYLLFFLFILPFSLAAGQNINKEYSFEELKKNELLNDFNTKDYENSYNPINSGNSYLDFRKDYIFHDFSKFFPIRKGQRSPFISIFKYLTFGYSNCFDDIYDDTFLMSLKKNKRDGIFYFTKEDFNSQNFLFSAKLFEQVLWSKIEPNESNYQEKYQETISKPFFIKHNIKSDFIQYENGEYYIGEDTLVDNNGSKKNKHGFGAYFFKNGDIREGYYLNDKEEGICVDIKKNGSFAFNIFLKGLKRSTKSELILYPNGNFSIINFNYVILRSNLNVVKNKKNEYYEIKGSLNDNGLPYDGRNVIVDNSGQFCVYMTNNIANGKGFWENGKDSYLIKFTNGDITSKAKMKKIDNSKFISTKEIFLNFGIDSLLTYYTSYETYEKNISANNILSSNKTKNINSIENNSSQEKINSCHWCNGIGHFVGCRNCTKGYIRCHICNGRGVLSDLSVCLYCRRSGMENCQFCHGRYENFIETCSICKGTGKTKLAYVLCYSCLSSGTTKCNNCNGDGLCWSCKGSARQNPNNQYNTEPCSICNGTGICRKCKGEKKIKCESCNGDGKFLREVSSKYKTSFGF